MRVQDELRRLADLGRVPSATAAPPPGSTDAKASACGEERGSRMASRQALWHVLRGRQNLRACSTKSHEAPRVSRSLIRDRSTVAFRRRQTDCALARGGDRAGSSAVTGHLHNARDDVAAPLLAAGSLLGTIGSSDAQQARGTGPGLVAPLAEEGHERSRHSIDMTQRIRYLQRLAQQQTPVRSTPRRSTGPRRSGTTRAMGSVCLGCGTVLGLGEVCGCRRSENAGRCASELSLSERRSPSSHRTLRSIAAV